MGLNLKVQEDGKPVPVWWTVNVSNPQTNGTVKKETFKVLFAILSDSEFAELASDEAKAADLLNKVILDWTDLTSNDAPVKFSEDMRENITNIPFVRAGLIDAYIAARQGYKPKN